MIAHPTISILALIEDEDASLSAFWAYLEAMPHVQLTRTSQLPEDVKAYDVLISKHAQTNAGVLDRIAPYVRAGGGWLLLVDLADQPLPSLCGVQAQPAGPEAELRVLFQDPRHPLAVRLPDAVYLAGRYHALVEPTEETETILYADWHYEHRPVMVHRHVDDGQIACTTLQAYDDPILQQILYRMIRHLAGHPLTAEPLGVGILGYAPSVGQLHGLAVAATAGLDFRAACDLSTERIQQARQDFPEIKTYTDARELAEDPAIHLVIIATPPNSHAQLSLQMMAAGKHVLCEKPLALTTKETGSMAAMAIEQEVHLSCHQNRRWDADYLAINQALTEGMIGELFYMETFVGGFHHPCGYWHSHRAVSGGTTYDWGAHYLDWIVGLIPDRVTAVIGTLHNHVWHDVTNADQERIQIRFAGGREAEFIHSDIAAVRKPKWYLLGTAGAIIGHWQDITAYEVDPVLYYHRHDIPATEMLPDLTLYRRHRSGQIVPQKLAVPRREEFPFHRNLADHLLTGDLLAAPLEDSVKVVAILEAAARSAAGGGSLEVLDG
jgi:predicted dehydrogenase